MRHYLNKLTTWYLVLGAFPSVVLVVTACGGANDQQGSNALDRIPVVATIYPMAYFAQRVGGDGVRVVSLVKPGVEAHAFEPTAGDLQQLADAQVIVTNGAGLEPWLDRALEALGGQRRGIVVEASDPALAEAATARRLDDGEIDPHLWLDPLLAIDQANRIRDALAAADPDGAASYGVNAAALEADLLFLDELFADSLSSCRRRHFVTTHAAYGYLAERYALEQVPISGLSPEAEPSARELARLIELVDGLDLRFVLAEPALPLRLAETVAAESGLAILPIHQMESVTRDELAAHGDYLGLMRANLASLVTALECTA
jgi:zinc transport system substrate-binding protein